MCVCVGNILYIKVHPNNLFYKILKKQQTPIGRNLKKAQRELTKIYQKEQLQYTQHQIDKFRNSVEDTQSQQGE